MKWFKPFEKRKITCCKNRITGSLTKHEGSDRQHQQHLCRQHHKNQCYRIGECIGRGDIICAGGADQCTESRGGGHAARDRSEIVKNAEFKDIFGKKEADHHWHQRHQCAVQEVGHIYICHKVYAAGHACTDQKQNKSQFAEKIESVRVGDKYKTDADGIGGGRYGQHHVILDHLTSSWSIDECLSIYKTKNLTVQWCMINQSLTCSVHTKGCHGFGGIWGGYKATFHHNLLANHSSRNPRFSSVDSTKMVDFRNNVVFNWGFKAAYGGGRYGEINMVANYYKPGPGTQCPYKLLDVAEDGTGKYYISGNILEGNVAVSQDNRKGVFGKDSLACLVSLPFAYETIQEDTPQEAYRRVLEQAGCSLVRDNYDSEIVSQIKRGISLYGKNGFIDTPAQAGGWPELRKGTPLQDSDGDGMPDKWEKEHKLNPQDAGDASSFTICKYYTNIELYINGLVKY